METTLQAFEFLTKKEPEFGECSDFEKASFQKKDGFRDYLMGFLKDKEEVMGVSSYLEIQSKTIDDYCIKLGVANTHFIGVSYPAEQSTYLHIEECFEMEDKEKILNFIEMHPELDSYLEKSFEIIRSYFNLEKLKLRLVEDPESDNPERTLFIVIQTKLSPKPALNILEKVDKKLFEDFNFDSNILNINLSYK